MIRTLDRYLLAQFLRAWAVVLCLVLGLYVLLDAFGHASDFVGEGPGGAVARILRYYGAQLPVIFHRLSPFIALAGAMLSVSFLNRQNELVPMKACGVGIGRILAPVFAGAIGAAVLATADRELLIPALADRLRETDSRGRAFLRPPVVTDGLANVHMARYEPAARRAMGMEVVWWSDANRRVRHVRAEEAQFDAARGGWSLSHGFDAPTGERGTGPGAAELVQFGQDGLFLGSDQIDVRPEDIECQTADPIYYGWAQLARLAKRFPEQPHLRVQLAARAAAPLAHVILLLIGLPFVARPDTRSPWLGLIICVSICASYFLADFLVQDLGKKGLLDPIVAGCLAPAAYLAIGLLLFRRCPS